ncbi:glycoside hydrolase family 13 protein [Gleimia hominis]|uniref:glycoside hydrolase family 13 protein n=1 Tax=Gleimia hominis TaxID=595468 RepID=UPI000C80135A|nr:glycoside hydrolase family 13 protein [Gleimia hominis]WIK65048.1 glycoside hydrolase family 13 protein [Gleimia hominis]
MTQFVLPTPTAKRRFDSSDPNWWRQAVVYQIYPRSFQDSNGDGIGDFQGIISRIDYLEKLGIDAVWLSPFYPSQLADGGYDVDDYRDVDPRIGTLEDFDELATKLHERGIRIIIDIVPNHTSNRHQMFKEAVAAGPGSPERDRYIFRDGRGEHGELPPSDWESTFGGRAWTQVEDGQWYYHFFAREQPDLNWRNPEVKEEFLETLRFWSDRGVDGFRIDVAHGLAKDLPEILPTQEQLDALPHDGKHPLWDRDDVQDIYATWREVFNSYDPPRTAVAEAWVHPDRIPRYANPQSLGQAFNFDLLKANFDAGEFRQIVTHNLKLAKTSGSSSTWVLNNHDVVRHPTRYGLPPSKHTAGSVLDNEPGPESEWLLSGGKHPHLDREKGARRAQAATAFMLALPGSAYIYQGEELGLHEVVEIMPAERQDPTYFRTQATQIGRDGCRVPIPWTQERPAFGFSTAQAHLPQPDWFANFSVETEEADSGSFLHFYRAALAWRAAMEGDETLQWCEDLCTNNVLAFERPGGWVCVTNFGSGPIELPQTTSPDTEANSRLEDVVLSTQPLVRSTDSATQIPGETTVWIRAAQ